MKLSKSVLVVTLLAACAAPRAEALHPRDVGLVQNMLFHLRQRVTRIRVHAERHSHRFGWWEREMLSSLYEVESSADALARILPEWFRNRWVVEQRYQHLVAHANLVESRIHRSWPMQPALHDWQRSMVVLNRVHTYLYGYGAASPAGSQDLRDAERRERFEALHRPPTPEA